MSDDTTGAETVSLTDLLARVQSSLEDLHTELRDKAHLAVRDGWTTEFLDHFEEAKRTFEQVALHVEFPGVVMIDRSTDELELSVRSYNCLKNADIRTIRDLVQTKANDLLRTKNFGRRSLNEIKEILEGMHLKLGMQNLPPRQ